METLIIIASSGVVSAIISLLSVTLILGQYKQKVDHLKEDQDKIIIKIDNLRTDTDTLKEFKVNAQKYIDNQIFKAKSPLQLTEIGKKMVEESGFSDIFENVKNDIVLLLDQKKPTTKYDVQEKARSIMDELTNYPAFQPIKTYAFNSGNDFSQILRAGSILLRDYYLSLHPEIKE